VGYRDKTATRVNDPMEDREQRRIETGIVRTKSGTQATTEGEESKRAQNIIRKKPLVSEENIGISVSVGVKEPQEKRPMRAGTH